MKEKRKNKKRNSLSSQREKLGKAVVHRILESEQHACYVLITCGAPSEEGEMEVEMTYEGDHALASYLIDHAHQIMHPAPSP